MIKKETIDLHSWLFETFFHVYETKTYGSYRNFV